jgi:phage tail-like protein
MPQQFVVNANRLDPYKNFKFRLKWDAKYVAGITKVSPLKRSTEAVEFREGGDPNNTRLVPGRTKFDPITLERGVTYDASFEQWANLVWKSGADPEGAVAKAFKDINLDIFDEHGQLVISYKIYRCWVSEYQALPELDAHANAVAIEHIKLENEGWERDLSVPEPQEPKMT